MRWRSWIAAWLLLRNRDWDWKRTAVVYLVFACIFRTIGMYFGNTFLFMIFYTSSVDSAYALSAVYIPWNIVQAIINVVLGIFLYQMIPENLRIQAGLGEFRNNEQTAYEELSENELDE